MALSPPEKQKGHHPLSDDGPWFNASVIAGYIIRRLSAG
jgi:hypothetical protein